MYRRAILIAGLALTASVTVGQQTGAPFWQTPGTTLRDAKGNITYTEIKDPKTFTTRILDRGQWLTYHYEPNSTKVSRVEGPDTTEDYLYQGDDWNGLTVHARGRAHTIHVAGRTITADSMPAVTIERNAQGRDALVKRGKDVVATINYDAKGQAQSLTIGAMTLRFMIQPDGIREELTANGAILLTTVARPEGKHQFPISLDPVVDRLGLTPDWRNTTHTGRSATGSLISVSDTRSRPIVEIIELGGMAAAFDTKGTPLFYELALNYTATPEPGAGDAYGDVTTLLNGILPNRLIVPVTGDASVWVSRPGDGAISSVWTATNGVMPSYQFRVHHDGTKTSATSVRNLHAVAEQIVTDLPRIPPREIATLMMWQCGTEERWVCGSDGYSGYCYNYYEPEYCETGGAYTPPPDDGSGGGGGSGAGNHVTNDPALQVAVNAALSSANSKFSNTRCSQDLFKDTNLADGTSLADTLARQGSDAASWLNNSLRFINGYANGSCEGHPAWTTVNNTTVNICTSFKNVGSSQGAVTLIHEELHTLGLTEKPGYPDAAMDSAQITELVMNYCGG